MRWPAVIAMLLAPAVAGAQDATGYWAGTYVCNQGKTAITLEIMSGGSGLNALAHFFADPSNPRVPQGCFELQGRAGKGGEVSLAAGAWRLRPPGYVGVDLVGRVSSDGRSFTGQVIGPNCTSFTLHRMKVADDAAGACRLNPLS